MPITRLGLDGYGVHRSGSFAGKTPSGGGGAHPVKRITRLGPDGYGVRREGSFAGKASGGGGGSHPVAVLTRLALDGYGARRAGNFGAKRQAAPVTKPAAAGGDDVPRKRKKSKPAFDLEAWKATQIDFESTVRDTYEALMRSADAREAAVAISEYQGSAGIDWQSVYQDPGTLGELISLRLQQEEEEAIVMLLLH